MRRGFENEANVPPMTRVTVIRTVSLAALCMVVLALGGCSAKSDSAEGGAKKSGSGARRGPPEFPVKTITVAQRPVEYEVETVGSLVEENLYKIPSEVLGTAEGVKFAEGDRVTTGQELCRIDYGRWQLQLEKAKSAVREQEAAVKTAEATLADTERKTSSVIDTMRIDLELAESEYRRRAGLTQGSAISEEDRKTYEQKFRRATLLFNDALAGGRTQIAAAQAALNEKQALLDVDRATLAISEDDLDNAIVRAPIAGVIQERSVVNGQYLTLGTVVATMVNTDPVRLRFTVPESKSSVLDRSMRVKFTVPAFPDRVFDASIYDIGAVADPQSREVTCWALVSNPGYELRPGYFAKVRVLVASKKATIVVPLGCVQPTEGGLVCWVVKDGKAGRRQVKTGVQVAGDAIEVLSGISVGEQIVTEGATALQEGVAVKVLDASAADVDSTAPAKRKDAATTAGRSKK